MLVVRIHTENGGDATHEGNLIQFYDVWSLFVLSIEDFEFAFKICVYIDVLSTKFQLNHIGYNKSDTQVSKAK